MNTLYGTPPPLAAFEPSLSRTAVSAAPVVYARAVHFFPDETGRRTLSDDLLIEVARRIKRGESLLDVVLVTDDAALALVSRLPMGLLLVGVVAEKEMRGEVGDKIAVVFGVPNLQRSVAEGDLLIVDAEKSRVLVEPDAEEFVRLQAERHRARVLLGAAHTVAQTLAGRTVPVWASVKNARDVQDALAAGADGIVVETGGDLLAAHEAEFAASQDATAFDAELDPFAEAEASANESMSLLTVVEAVGGGEIGLSIPFGLLDPALVVSLAGISDLRWAVSPDALPLPLSDLRQELAQFVGDEANAALAVASGGTGDDLRADCGAVPRFAALAASVTGDDTAAADLLTPFDEIWLAPPVFENLTLGDIYALPLVRALLGDALDVLPEVIALGAHGVVVAPHLVGVTKDMIRQQPN